MQRFAPTPPVSGEAAIGPDRLRFGLLALLLVATFLMGGSARLDAASLLFLRPLTAVIFVAAVMTALPTAWRRAPDIVAVAAAALLLCLAHLIPLPPSLWTALPGRQIAVDVYRAAGIALPWHPLTLTPQHSWNAVFFLLAPLSALILTLSLTPARLRQIILVLIGLAVLNAGIGALQSLGAGWLHFYDITNRDNTVGLFANRNHAALSFACALPLIGLAAGAGRNRAALPARMSGSVAVLGILLFLPVILLTGSRAGLVWAALAVAMMLWVHRGGAKPGRAATAWPWIAAVAFVIVAATFILRERAPALLRLAETGESAELRLNVVPAIWQAVRNHWPSGSGIGSFVEVYGIYEPQNLLGITYLNHAHNDLLEILLTGGLPAAFLLAAGAACIVRAMMTPAPAAPNDGETLDDPRYARAGLSIIVLLSLGSIVDYPLRTPTLAVLLAVAAAWTARRKPLPHPSEETVHHAVSRSAPVGRRRTHRRGADGAAVRDTA